MDREIYVDGGQIVSGITLSRDDYMWVFSGGTAKNITLKEDSLLTVSGGVATNIDVKKWGQLTIESGGTATNVSWTPCVGYVLCRKGAVVTFTSEYSGVYYGYGQKLVSHAEVISSKTIGRKGTSFEEINVMSGGTAVDIKLKAEGELDIFSGGTAINPLVSGEEAVVNVYDGGRLVNPTINYGNVYVHEGGTMVSPTITSKGYLFVNSGGRLTGRMILNGSRIYTSEKEDSWYSAIGFDNAIVDFDLTCTSPGAKELLNDYSIIEYYGSQTTYTLTVTEFLKNGLYKLAEGASGFKETLSVVSTSGVQYGSLSVGQTLSVNGKDYTLNRSGSSLTVTVSGITPPDTAPPVISQITGSPTTTTKGSVTVSASFTDNMGVAATYYKLGDSGPWRSFSNSVTVTENTIVYFKAIDEAGNESGIASYKVDNIKSGSGIVVDPGGMPDGSTNNWLYDKKQGLNPNIGDFIETVISPSMEEIRLDRDEDVSSEDWLNYVGYGDEYDFAKIHLENAAKLSFSATATDAAKLTVYSLTPGKNAGTYTMKALQTTTLKKPKNETKYTAETKELLLEAGDYYIAMQSTAAKKGGSAFYNVNLNEKSVFFTNGDGGWNNWLYEKKTGLNPNIGDFIETVISPSMEEIRLDRDEDVDFEGWLNFVGYDDPADFAKIVLESDASLSFTIRATDAAKFVIYKLNGKADKNGGITYSLKALQTTKLKKGKNDVLYTADTKNLMLEAGKYYISVQSTNAKKGGNAYYSVCLNEERSWFAWYDLDSIAAPDVQLADATGSPAKSDALNAFGDAFDGSAADLATAGFEGLTDAKLSDWQDLAKLA